MFSLLGILSPHFLHKLIVILKVLLLDISSYMFSPFGNAFQHAIKFCHLPKLCELPCNSSSISIMKILKIIADITLSWCRHVCEINSPPPKSTILQTTFLFDRSENIQKVSEYDQKIPQSQTTDQPTAP